VPIVEAARAFLLDSDLRRCVRSIVLAGANPLNRVCVEARTPQIAIYSIRRCRGYESRISNRRRPSVFSSRFTALEAAISS
jgi:hypothetical protein